jgi:acetylornithine/succinyldiaminopimelate/putrescine aminotransferase
MSEANDLLFNRNLAQTTPFPLGIEVERAEGIYIYDVHGKRYADLISGIGVSSLGHNRKEIVAAIREQATKFLHVMVYGEFIQKPQTEFAQLLSSALPENLNTVYFVNSGAEAIEASLKLAKRVTGRTKIISCKKSYHGNTHGALSVSGNEMKKYAFRPLLPDVYFINFNSFSDLEKIDNETACFIMETVQGDAGVRIPDLTYMKALRKRCDEVGALLIFDEIQCGMGRTGKMFAFEHFDVVPDILSLGKALGGGLPIGACISSLSNMRHFTSDPILGHITTFGGHPLVCASGHAALRVLISQNILAGVDEKGRRIKNILTQHPSVREVRQIGLFIAVDLESEDQVRRLVDRCLEKGILIFWFLSCPSSFRLAPPLTIGNEEIDRHLGEICEILDEIRT